MSRISPHFEGPAPPFPTTGPARRNECPGDTRPPVKTLARASRTGEGGGSVAGGIIYRPNVPGRSNVCVMGMGCVKLGGVAASRRGWRRRRGRSSWMAAAGRITRHRGRDEWFLSVFGGRGTCSCAALAWSTALRESR